MKLLQLVAFDVVCDLDHQHEVITGRGTCDSSSNHSDSDISNNSDSGNSNIIEIDGDKQDDGCPLLSLRHTY